MAMIDQDVGRCHNCGRYFPMKWSPDAGHTCSKKCSQEYVGYLNAEISETGMKVITLDEVDKHGKKNNGTGNRN